MKFCGMAMPMMMVSYHLVHPRLVMELTWFRNLLCSITLSLGIQPPMVLDSESLLQQKVNSVAKPAEYVENAPKDMVTALPGQVTRIKATFDKPGRYVWHCHILSHEDHEMMRVLHVGPELIFANWGYNLSV